MSGVRHSLFHAGFSAISLTGANRWLRPLAQGHGVILAFHRVRPWAGGSFTPNGFLEITPEFLQTVINQFHKAGFEFLSLDAVPGRLVDSRPRRPFVVFTFDDGYRDNLRHAWPILRKNRIPWTIFLVPEFIMGKGVMWWLDLEALIKDTQLLDIVVRNEAIRLPVRSAGEKYAAFATVASHLMLATRQELEAFSVMAAERLGQKFGFHSQLACARWAEIRELSGDDAVSIGTHTLSHPVLSRLEPTEVEVEMYESRACLEQELGVPVRHLAYPHGGPKEAGIREFSLARDAGYVCAVTTRPSHVWPRHADMLHRLPRVSMNGLHQSRKALDAIISGVPFLLTR